MTLAICIKCGGEKTGAFVECRGCKFRPVSEDDMAKSLMVTDHYFPTETLWQISSGIAAGEDMKFSPENVAQFVNQIRAAGTLRMLGIEAPNQPAKKPWWKIFR